MALYQRGQIWYADFYDRGRRVQESTGTDNGRKAEKFLALRISEIERGVYAKPVNITLSEFGEKYMEFAKANKRSWLRDQQILKHLHRAFGSSLLTEITALPIERYKLDRLKAVSPATVNRELKRIFNVAEQWGLFRGGIRSKERNSWRRIICSFAPCRTRRKPRSSSAALRICTISSSSLSVPDFRLGEILNLTWKEVDRERGSVKILVRKNRRILEVPLNDAALAVVKGWHGIRKCEYVYYNPETGGQWKDLWLGLKKVGRKAGVEGVTWHTFRHTFASRLTRAGVDLVTVKERLGHSTV